MGLRGEAAIVGYVELPPERLNKATPAPFTLEQWAELGAAALEDAGLPGESVDGIVTTHLRRVGDLRPVDRRRIPRCPSEFRRDRRPRRGQRGRHGVAGRGRDRARASATWCCARSRPGYITPTSEKKPRPLVDAMFFGASSNQYGSPQAEFEIPYGNLGQNGPYGQVAQRYARGLRLRRARHGQDRGATSGSTPTTPRARSSRTSRSPSTTCWRSPVIADPLHMLEIVMPCVGGAAVVVASAERGRAGARNRPVWIKGFGEQRALQDAHLRRRSAADADHPGRRDRRSRWPGLTPADDGHGVDLRLLHDHRAADPRGRGLLREGQGHGSSSPSTT